MDNFTEFKKMDDLMDDFTKQNLFYSDFNNNVKYVICSYKRPKMFLDKTYSLLKRHRIPDRQIYLMLHTEEEKESYEKEIESRFSDSCYCYIHIIVHFKDGIMNARNYVIDVFDEGDMIVEMDDDIDDIVLFDPEGTMPRRKKQSVQNLNRIVCNYFYNVMVVNDGLSKGLWGICSTDNPFFAGKGGRRVGRQCVSMINSFIGYYNDKRIKLDCKEKEDFDRVCQFFDLGIKTIKDCNYGIKTRYWKNKGGLQSRYDEEARLKVQEESAQRLLDKYPKYCYKQTRKNGKVDIRFRRTIEGATKE